MHIKTRIMQMRGKSYNNIIQLIKTVVKQTVRNEEVGERY